MTSSPMRRVPPDVIAWVEEQQRPRETFGAALRRLTIGECDTPSEKDQKRQSPAGQG